LALGLCLAPALCRPATVRYQADSTTDFKNPERGLFVQGYFYGAGKPGNEALNAQAFKDQVASNPTGHTAITLMRRYFCLRDFRNRPLDADILSQINADFGAARSLGIKLIPRFSYNEGPIGEADAPESVVMGHIRQLTPVLRANADVIAYLEAGFVGTWGEWHHSTNGLTDPSRTATPAMGRILRAELAALPADRMVAMRYPGYTSQIFGRSEPIAAAEAFKGSDYARIGTYDDCFEADYWDMGSYDTAGATPSATKAFLGKQNLYTVEGGETCQLSDYADCANTLADLKALHWSDVHAGYHPQVIQGWVKGGCMDLVAALGYRYRLTSSTLPSGVKRGGILRMRIGVANDGTANCYNPRGFEIVVRPHGRKEGGAILALSPDQSKGTDPRFWEPGVAVYTARVAVRLPATLPLGRYDVLLNLPDPAPGLRGRPDYSIRLANTGLWEAATGYNDLKQTFRILPR
jgi:hypothetical protein